MGSGPRKEPEDVPWVLQDAPRCTGFEQTHPPVLFEGLCCSWGAQRGAGASSPTAPRAPGQLRGKLVDGGLWPWEEEEEEEGQKLC